MIKEFIVVLLLVAPSIAQNSLPLDPARLKSFAALGEIKQLNNSRLHALLENPDRFRDLDQRRFLAGTNAVEQVLAQSLALPKTLLPNMFSSMTVKNSILSICLSDNMLFVWRALGDADAVAMIPLMGPHQRHSDAAAIHVWICASRGLAQNTWSSILGVDEVDGGMQAQLENLTGGNIKLSSVVENEHGLRKIQGIFKTDQADRHVSFRVGQRIVSIEIAVSIEELNDGRPSPRGQESKKVPKAPIFVPVNWPPKN